LVQEFPAWQFLLVDLRCHKDSASRRGSHSVTSTAFDVLKLVGQPKITPRVLVGHSFGGKFVLSVVKQAAKPLAQPVRAWVLDVTPGEVRSDGNGEDHPAELISLLSTLPKEVSSKRDVLDALIQQEFSKEAWLALLDNGLALKVKGVYPRLVELLLHPLPTILIPALRAVGNIVTGDGAQTQFEDKMLPCLYQPLTQNHKKCIKTEACCTTSNITAENKGQIRVVVETNIILPLVHLLQHVEFDIKKGTAWAISNASSGGSHGQIQFLVKQGSVTPLCDLLIYVDPRIVAMYLEGLESILKVEGILAMLDQEKEEIT
jgi:hypothetical protein